MLSHERDTRIPYCLGTDQYCKFYGCDEYVHMGDLVTIFTYPRSEDHYDYCGNLSGVKYDSHGFISEVTITPPGVIFDFNVAFDGFFRHATKVEEHDD